MKNIFWGDCPKIQNKILKVRAEHRNLDILRNEVGVRHKYKAVRYTKIENGGRSKTFFGQSEGVALTLI